MISLPSEGQNFFSHTLIVSRLFERGEKTRGRGGIGGNFLGSKKSVIHPAGYLYLFLIYWCLGKIIPPLLHWLLHLNPGFPLVFGYVFSIKTWILNSDFRIFLKIYEPCFDWYFHLLMASKSATLFIYCAKLFFNNKTN